MKQKGIASGTIAVVIVVASTLVVVNVLHPFIEEGKSYQGFNEARSAIRSISSAVSRLAVEATGAQRSIDINLRSGRLIVSDSDDTIKIRLNDLEGIVIQGFSTLEGHVEIRGGAFMRAYESDINNDGTADLVLENSAVIFAVKKITPYSAVNTTNFITLMRNKRTSVNVTPVTGIFINDIFNTSYGTGYSQISPVGDNIESSAIKLFVNSSAGIAYEAQFSMAAAQDFIDMRIKRVEGI